MVIPYENDAYFVDLIPGDRFVRVPGHRVVVRLEHQPDRPMQVDRKLPQAVPFQWMWPAGGQLCDKYRGFKVGQPVLQPFRTRNTERSDHARVLLTQLPK